MNCTAIHLPYQETGFFSKIITDYLDQAGPLTPFYAHPVSLEGIKSAIHARQQFPTDRKMLTEELKRQYAAIGLKPEVAKSIDQLQHDNCFTITTAHQPAIFTGNLYFLYKILHVIKLAQYLSEKLPDYRFVPVFFMGSEDADLEELGSIYLGDEKIVWDAQQNGAVGRMKPKGLDKIVERIAGEYAVLPFGEELVKLIRCCYLESENIQAATLRLVDALFARYGLVVLIPDNISFKKKMTAVFEDDLVRHTPAAIARKTIQEMAAHYDIQANPRDINLFYLKDDLRERIVEEGEMYKVVGTSLSFSKEALLSELKTHPERFSPNVILRGLFQETILPGIVFIGGGGETAYWLELMQLFKHYGVPYPVLVLRNSFLIVEKKWREKLEKTGYSLRHVFRTEEELLSELVKKESKQQLDLAGEIGEANRYFEKLKQIAHPVDPTLVQYVEALQSKTVRPLIDLEKKLLKAEKRKFEDQRLHIHSVRQALFPLNNLQERIENFMPYYAKWGTAFIDMLHRHSSPLEQRFCILAEE